MTITDATDDSLRFSAGTNELAEGGSTELLVALGAGITSVADQVITLTVGGTAQVADFSLASGGVELSAPYTLTLPAGAGSVSVTLTVVDDAEQEGSETVTLSASRGGNEVGQLALTVAASDAAPQIRIAAVAEEVPEGSPVEFTVTRTNPTEPYSLPAQSVPIVVTDAGGVLAGTAPTEVSFAEGGTSSTVSLATDDDTVIRTAPSEVAVSLTADPADPPAYTLAGTASAATVVAETDQAGWELTVPQVEVTEGTSVTVSLAIANGVTFAQKQTIRLALSGTASASDYTVVPAGLQLAAGLSSVTATLAAATDEEDEEAETVTITATHDGVEIGSAERDHPLRLARRDAGQPAPVRRRHRAVLRAR